MKYALVLRKLVINENIYYQVMDKVIGETVNSDSIKVIEGEKFLNSEFTSIEYLENGSIGYYEIDKDFYDEINLDTYYFFKKVNDSIDVIKDFQEENDVVYEFYKTFHDFKLIPDYNIEEIINNTRNKIKEKILGQDEPVNRILSKIYNNQMFFETNLDTLDMKNNKSNILLMGPFGTGKTTIKEVLKKSLEPIPIVEYKLTGDYKKDITEIIKKLIFLSNGNLFLAERGIVVFDGINALSSRFVDTDNQTINIYIDTLQKILETTGINMQFEDGRVLHFDYSLITNICLVDINYDYQDDIKDENDVYYSRVNGSTFLELGFTPDMLIDSFDNEVIFMKEIDYDLAIRILKDKNISPLYKIKKTLENKGKTVRISHDFVDYLVEYAIEYNEGFAGIIKTLKYLLQSKNISSKTITFKSEDIDNLKIGSIYNDEIDDDYDDDTEVQKEKLNTKTNNNVDDSLNVDLSKKTINSLTRKDTIELIKKNIKGQDTQIFSIVNCFYEHVFNKYKGFSDSEYRKLKDNILIIGSTGVGKTSIIENLARIFNIPFKREDATRYSSTGIVGEDVDSMLKDLVELCSGNVKKAEHGIIFIDEIDKIASSFDRVDVGKGVQNALLTLVEGNKITIRPEVKEYFKPYTFDTSNVLFIAAGAFEGIDNIKKARIKKEKGNSSVGFKDNSNDKNINEDITIDDLNQYGMSTQLMARLSNVVNLNILNEDILLDIIENSEDGYVNLQKKSYEFDGIKIEMSEGFKRNLAKKAFLDKKGARSIKTTFKRVLDEIDKNILDNDIEKVILSDNSLDNLKSIQ
ncbi:MAG: AAA family ATPase [Bacilli bacterium]|nr:AAA family ATPase [Bacilli bacterium]